MTLKRSELTRKAPMARKPSKLKRSPVGHASDAQRAKVRLQGCRLTAVQADEALVDAAHIIARPQGGCDDELCIIGLRRDLHVKYDRGELSILEHLTTEEQAHAVGHAGILSALKRTTGDDYLPVRDVERVA